MVTLIKCQTFMDVIPEKLEEIVQGWLYRENPAEVISMTQSQCDRRINLTIIYIPRNIQG